MPRLKPLLPTLRERKRYVVFRVHTETPIYDLKALIRAILQESIHYMGVQTFARAGINILPKYYDSGRQYGIIRVGHTEVEALRQSLARTRTVKQDGIQIPVVLQTVGVSGIIKKAKERYIDTVPVKV